MDRKPDIRMSYTTLLSLPDSKSKYLKLERKLMKLQPHGPAFFEAQEEWKRLYKKYHEE